MNSIIKDIQNSIYTGHIDGSFPSIENYQPKLIINSKEHETKVLASILSELKKCDEFFFSVAFVTNSGVATLIDILKELEAKDIRGKIIVSQYQNFTEPRALERLTSLKNLDIRIICEGNFHAKGYIFHNKDAYSLIIGSSNLTANALCLNQEWNLKVSSSNQGSLILDTLKEFNRLFESATIVDSAWISEYEKIYREQSFISKHTATELEDSLICRISPNKMQISALQALDTLRSEGRNKALLISATGTGKTYLSAFDVKKVEPKRFLFVVHRENIARTAMKTFQKVFGKSKKMGLLTGNVKDFDAEYLFSTMQTLSKSDTLERFEPRYFNYIVIDEVHRTGASSYQKILSHFSPDFLLGMSATPERTDGFDIFKAFDYNIAYEIRLHTALEENMLVPFHYYGVSDITIDGELLDDNSNFNDLIHNERVERVIQHSQFYGCDRGRVKGLIFCSRREEAKQISAELNKKGLHTLFLDGNSNESKREESILKLESDDPDDYLDYILTVDIFNEGIDIPSLNQIIMLRPTQSAIVFVQQLGRGLRKAENKEYLTVIDFIGNYSNNYLVPTALYGDNSYNKDTLRKVISSGSNLIPGASTVNFDQISKQRIYESIDTARINSYNLLKEDYNLLRYKLGRIPTMMDFVNHGSRDPFAYVEKEGSLYAFVAKQEKNPKLSVAQMKRLSFFSKEVCDGIRLEEVIILKSLMARDNITVDELIEDLRSYGIATNEESIESAIKYLNGVFHQNQETKKYNSASYIIVNDRIITKTPVFCDLLQSPTVTENLQDSIEFAIHSFTTSYNPKQYFDGFSLYHKYSRKDVCRLLNWPKDEHSTMYGYRIKYNTCPIFVTYNKSDDITESTNYEDYFLDNQHFHWMTRNRVKLDSTEVQKIREHEDTGMRICLFVKKSDAESSDFYYMGDVTPYEYNQLTIKNDQGAVLPIVNINYKMKCPVADNIYNYLEG